VFVESAGAFDLKPVEAGKAGPEVVTCDALKLCDDL